MNLKQVSISVLIFGVAGLLLFMYLQAWIEEQHTAFEEKLRQQIIQDFKLYYTEEPASIQKNWIIAGKSNKASTTLTESGRSQGGADPVPGREGSFSTGLSEETPKLLKQFKQVNVTPIMSPSNTSVKEDHLKAEIQGKRKSFLDNFCKKHSRGGRPQINIFRMVSRIYVEEEHQLLYCEVPKAGCSNWKRVLMVLAGLADSTANITHDSVHYGKHLRKLDSYDPKEVLRRLETYTKVIFVRDPMERLVSAFRDKFEHPNSYYHPVFGKAIIKKYRHNADKEALVTGSGVKFEEFVQYLLDSRRPVGMDIHWEQISKLCYPCIINYNFIGKFETLEEDANYLLRLIGAPKGLTFPNFKDRHSSDERTNSEVVQQYLAGIPSTEREKTYSFYYQDYLMFNYTPPYVET